MLRTILLFLFGIMVPASLAICQGSSPSTPRVTDLSRLAGVWRGQEDGLPAIDLVLSDEGAALRGAILFYLHKRIDSNHPYTATPGLPEPIFELKREGDTLTFLVSHRYAHPPGSLHDSPSHFRLTITASNRAQLLNVTEDSRMWCPLERSDY